MACKIPVSVIMPCYNCGQYVSQAIESILSQSFRDFEFIIINDGSTDNSDEEIRKHGDKRIQYISFNKNKGNYSTRNEGLKIAKGKYVCVMDADDIAETGRLATQFNYLENHPKIGGLGSFGKTINENGAVTGQITKPLHYSRLKVSLLKDNYTLHPSLMFRSSFLKKHQLFYDEKLYYAADYDFVVRCSKYFPIVNIDKPLIKYRIHPGQISSAKYAEQKKFGDIIRLKQLEEFGVPLIKNERDIYLRLMRAEYIPKNLIEKGIEIFNRLLQSNKEIKLHKQNHLYEFFDCLIALALQKQQQGGWAIEKEIINFINQEIPSGKSILEFGSGAGTDVLLDSYKVISIEHDKSFLLKRSQRHKCIYAPIQNDKWYHRNKVRVALTNDYDLILIDGPPGELRKGILEHLDLFRNSDKPIIFDDINRDLDKAIMISFCNSLNYQYQIFTGSQKSFAYCVKKLSTH